MAKRFTIEVPKAPFKVYHSFASAASVTNGSKELLVETTIDPNNLDSNKVMFCVRHNGKEIYSTRCIQLAIFKFNAT